jgi:hypothetical protein
MFDIQALPLSPRRRAAIIVVFLIDVPLHVCPELPPHQDGEPPHFVTDTLIFEVNIF